MLLGRRAERSRLDRLVINAQRGTSGVLLMRGEAGIGKSVLLQYAVERGRGMRVLTARGVETELELPFAGLSELLCPVLNRLEHIPQPQAAALRAALALASPTGADRFATMAGTLSLIAAVADEQPVIVAVDDAHWLDRGSIDSLLFVARRLRAERVALLLTVRDEESTIFDGRGLPDLVLTGLGTEEAEQLLDPDRKRGMTEEILRHLVAETSGNPLALIELSQQLSHAQLAGVAPLPDPLRFGAGSVTAFRRRLANLEPDTRRALLLAASSDTGALREIAPGLDVLDLSAAALEPAESAGLVRIDAGELHWRHPLLRSAAYHGASPAERRSAHRALAKTVDAGDGQRRAWHLGASASGPDDTVATALEDAARSALARMSYTAAARGFERGAELSVRTSTRARRLLAAADAFWRGGNVDAARSLCLKSLGMDASLRSEGQRLLAHIEMSDGAPLLAHDRLVQEAERLSARDPGRATMLAEAAWAAIIAADITNAVRTAARAVELVDHGRSVQPFALCTLGVSLMLGGDRRAGRKLIARSRRVPQSSPTPESDDRRGYLAAAAYWLEDHDEARRLLEPLIEKARHASSLAVLSGALDTLGALDFRIGRWASAYAHSAESLHLAEDTGQTMQLASSHTTLARIEAGQGNETACRAHTASALDLADYSGAGLMRLWARAALGLLELSLGNLKEAVAQLEWVSDDATARGLQDPAAVPIAADLIEAYVRVGRGGDAKTVLNGLEARAEAARSEWGLATAARCRGLLAADDEFQPHFLDALRRHRMADMPFERARTELLFGGRLRRRRRRRDARIHLRSALATFVQLGAAKYAETARHELAATGEKLAPESNSRQVLTPQELQVALTVAHGATNREAADRLFLSPRTIDFHLGNIYRKLRLRSRTQLVGLFLTPQSSEGIHPHLLRGPSR